MISTGMQYRKKKKKHFILFLVNPEYVYLIMIILLMQNQRCGGFLQLLIYCLRFSSVFLPYFFFSLLPFLPLSFFFHFFNIYMNSAALVLFFFFALSLHHILLSEHLLAIHYIPQRGYFCMCCYLFNSSTIMRIKENQRHLHGERLKESFSIGVRDSSRTCIAYQVSLQDCMLLI